MKPVALEIVEFRGWRASGVVALDRPVTLVVGENGRGKSSLLQAVEWCLIGRDAESATRSGLTERADWEIRPRTATRDTEVRLVLRGPAGDVTVVRRRPRGAKTNAPDEVEVTVPGRALPLTGADAEAWLAALVGGPDGFRRAHALHAEQVRARAFDKDDRSAILAELMGLGAGVRGRDAVAAAKAPALVQDLERHLRGLERDLLAVVERPKRDREEVERRLETRGVPRAEAGPARAATVRRALVARATTLGTRLGLATTLPSPDDAAAVTAWAATWSATAHGAAPALAVLPARRTELASLETALTAQAPAEEAYRAAQDAYKQEVERGGDAARRGAAVDAALTRQREAEEAARRQGALVALLSDARAVVTSSTCPVCGTDVDDLPGRLAAEVARLGGPEQAALEKAKADAAMALKSARDVAARLDGLVETGKRLRDGWQRARATLARLLPGAAPDADLVALARARVDALRDEIASLDAAARERDDALTAHARDEAVLRDLDALADAVARLDRDVDVSALPAFGRFEAALDEAAGFASDAEAVAAILRDVQGEQAVAREAEVNRLVGDYYDLIVGGDARGLVVETHATAKQVDVRLVDRHGKPALPVLNQAALNAVSLAMLFAQAAERARAGGLALVLLDDPAQSLDRDRQAGLARAVERLASASGCAVVIATTDDALVERIRTHVAVPRRILSLGAWDALRGATLLGEGEER